MNVQTLLVRMLVAKMEQLVQIYRAVLGIIDYALTLLAISIVYIELHKSFIDMVQM